MFVVCFAPVLWVAWRAGQGDLTANPVEYITHFTGDWAIRFIAFTLAITPLRRLLRLPDLVSYRRMLGLYAFFYASMHFLTWFWLDKNLDFSEMLQDVVKRRFILAGFTAFVLMLPLALTSTGGWIRRLGLLRWQRLHRLVYITAIAAVVHYYWLVKSDIRWPVFYGVVMLVLLGSRLVGLRSKTADNTLRLTVSGIERQTPDTVTLRFPLPGGKLSGARPGQFLTFDWMVGGKTLPRSYSISSSPLESGYVEVTVKQQGVVSTFLNQEAKQGLTVVARGPYGQFYFDEKQHKNIVLLAGGSGVTPIMSMLRYIEKAAPETEIAMLYGVRTENDVVFKADLDDLQKRLPRFRYVVVASKPGLEWQGPNGHVNRQLVEQQLGDVSRQTFFLCGPPPFMVSVKEILLSLGARPDQIRQERFALAGTTSSSTAFTCAVEFTKSEVKLECSSSETLLSVAEKHGITIPYSCRVGQCGTCATRVLDGEVEMENEEGLEPALKAQGYRLLCVGRAKGPVSLVA